MTESVFTKIKRGFDRITADLRIVRLSTDIASRVPPSGQRPVVFFNASTRILGLSQNAAFSMLTSFALRLEGVPAVHFVCQRGMSRCVLGTDQDDPSAPLPCDTCVRQSLVVYNKADARFFSYEQDDDLAGALAGMSLAELITYEHPIPTWGLPSSNLPLGSLVLPGTRWRLRLHNLQDDEATRTLYREFMLSAWNVAREFISLLDQTDPQAAVIFNGQFFPEATARWLCQQRGIPSYTHEVGFQPLTAFFTPGEATASPINLPEDFELSAEQNARLDEYLENRFQGNFSMAGIRFWPEMKGLDEAFLQKLAGFEQLVPVFTNVIFDTSQPHSNVVFSDMFAWLDTVLDLIKSHPETLFVIRAHPDEKRPNSRKQARETVEGWARANGVDKLSNVVFYDSGEYVSSYELIQRARFVMVYNSSIGLEASIMGAAVLCGGKARYTQYPTVFFPQTVSDFRAQAEAFLTAGRIEVPATHRLEARRFLYYQLFRTSLPFDRFIVPFYRPGMVKLKKFGWHELRAENSPAIKAVLDGLLRGGEFLLED
ncbi:MAG: hypothetical protein AB1846_16065 [Chloroflexota bacterium]